MSQTLIIGAILLIGAFAIPDTTDTVVAESLKPAEFLEEGSGNDEAAGSDILKILKAQDASTAGSFNDNAIAFAKNPAVREAALKIRDEATRQDTIDSLTQMESDIKLHLAGRKASAVSTEDSCQTEDAEDEFTNYVASVHNRSSTTSNTELFQYEYDESNTDPEYLEVKEYHRKWKSLIQEHNVDTSQARLRSTQEHNELVAGFIVDSFMETHDTVQGDKTLGAKCLQGILLSIPPDFCWKRGHHNHDTCYTCPSGWHKWGAECFENCRGGYYWVGGGTCWAHCRSGEEELAQLGAPKEDQDAGQIDENTDFSVAADENTDSLISTSEAEKTGQKVGLWRRRRRRRRRSPYSDHGATCYKAPWDWYAKHHYWASRITKFDSRVGCCHSDQYKSGAMCYSRCDIINPNKAPMVNCGWDACSSAGERCASNIMNMVFEIAFSIASIAALVVTAGAAAPATMAGSTLIKAAGKNTAKVIAKFSGKAVVKQSSQQLAKNTWKNAVKKFGVNQVKGALTENAVKAACNAYATAYYSRLGGDTSFNPANLDPTGTANAVTTCGDQSKSETACAAAVMGVIGVFDPTGLSGVAAAFMHDQCHV
jgi:hypothetical protein